MIHALVVYALLRFAVPDFIAGRVDMAIAILSGTSDPQIESLVTAMENMKKAHILSYRCLPQGVSRAAAFHGTAALYLHVPAAYCRTNREDVAHSDKGTGK